MNALDLADRAGHRPSELSGGEQQRVALARALVNKPTLVLADEPTGNLDSERSEDVLATLRRFNREHGQTFVLATHDPDVGQACDRVIRTGTAGSGSRRRRPRSSRPSPRSPCGSSRASADPGPSPADGGGYRPARPSWAGPVSWSAHRRGAPPVPRTT